MNRLIGTAKISVGLTLITISVLFIADFLGFMPDVTAARLDARQKLAEVVAVSMCSRAQSTGTAEMEAEALEILDRNPEILSIAIARMNGKRLFATSEHARLWGHDRNDADDAMRARVPLLANGQRWGSLEICFLSVERSGWLSVLDRPAMRLAGFMALVGVLVYTVYLRRVLRHLDPSVNS